MSASLALIDGDILVYRTGFAGQQTLVSAVLPDGTLVVDSAKNKTECLKELQARGIPEEDVAFKKDITLDDPSHVAHSLDVQIQSIMAGTRMKDYRVYLTGKGNFRERIAKTAPYKGNRVADKPVYYDFIRERLERKWYAEVVQGAEADDILAIRATENIGVVCSIDKDLLQVPGRHFNWLKDSEPHEVQPLDGAWWLFTQALCGDATDNIPGIAGLGTKGAEKYLTKECGAGTWEDFVQVCENKYTQVYGDDGIARFVEMFNLVYLCRTNEELQNAKQIASEGGAGLSPRDVAAARQYMSSMP